MNFSRVDCLVLYCRDISDEFLITCRTALASLLACQTFELVASPTLINCLNI